ncbi:hypothetical protein H0H93_014760 [Arthromyces matolae]|nr:hypothetical protein H0H93_014760 [Arthromyces matolae]
MNNNNEETGITLPRPFADSTPIVLPRPDAAAIFLPRRKTTGNWNEDNLVVSPQKRSRTVSHAHRGYRRARAKDTMRTNVQDKAALIVEETQEFVPDDAEMTINPTEYLVGRDAPTTSLSVGYTMDYSGYVDLVLSRGIGIVQIYDDVFVVQGWNRAHQCESTLWHHMWRSQNGDEVLVGCFCPQGRMGNDCHHARFLREYGELEFPRSLEKESGTASKKVILFVREPVGQNTYVNYFSVASRHGTDDLVKSRAIVVHEGSDEGGGVWKCSKDGNGGCPHVVNARQMLRQCLQNEDMMVDGALEVPEAGRCPSFDSLPSRA